MNPLKQIKFLRFLLLLIIHLPNYLGFFVFNIDASKNLVFGGK